MGRACARNISWAAAPQPAEPAEPRKKRPSLREILEKHMAYFDSTPPHSSCLCDPITAVHYPPSTRTGLYVLSANVDSALCSTASRAGSADWCDLKERKNKGEKKIPPCVDGCVHQPVRLLPLLPSCRSPDASPWRVRLGHGKMRSPEPPRNANAF